MGDNHATQRPGRLSNTPVGGRPALLNADLTGVCQWVSPEWRALTGFPESEVIGARFPEKMLDFAHPGDQQRVAGWRAYRDAGEPFSDRFRLRRAGGDWIWVEIELVVTVGSGGEPSSRLALLRDVTEQIEQRTRFQELVEALPAVVAVYDQDGGVISYVSPQMEQLTGQPPSHWQGRRLDDFLALIHPDDLAAQIGPWREAAASGQPFAVTYRLRGADGRMRWVSSIDNPLPGLTPVRQVLLFDVTAELEARHDRERMVEQLPAAIVRFDVRSRVMLYASDQIEALTGEPVEVWQGAAGYRHWAESMVDPQRPDWEALARSGRPWQNQYRWRRSDGAERWFRSVARIVAPDVVQAMVFDATAEVEAERALAVEQRRYRTLVEQMPAVIFRNRSDASMEYVSPQVEQLLGYSPEQFLAVINRDVEFELVHPDDRARAAESFPRLAGEDGSDELELRMRTHGGDYRTVLIRRARVDAPGGDFHVESVALDLTSLRDAESRSRAALAALVRAGEQAQARLAVELHDDALQSLTAVLLQLERTGSGRPEMIETLRGAIERLRRLMFELRPHVLERDGIAAAVHELTADGPWNQVDVDIAISRQSDTVEALCYRTIRELVINARNHSRARSLAISGGEQDGRLRFTVADDGVGFEAGEALDDERMRLHLGLRTLIERVRLAGGDLDIDATPGSGARIGFTVPAEPR